MKTDKNNKWLDDALERTISSERKEANFESFKQKHSQAVEKLMSRASRDTAESGPNIWRIIMKSRLMKLSAAAVIIIAVIAGISHFGGSVDGTSVAWADVIKMVSEAHNVKYKDTFHPGQKDEFTTEQMINEWGVIRTVYANSNIDIYDHGSGKELELRPDFKQAILMHRVGRKRHKGLFNYLDWIKTLHQKGAEFKGIEELDGREVELFVSESSFNKTCVWVDPATNLPVRVEEVRRRNPDERIVIPRMGLSKGDFGGDANESMVISISGEMGIQSEMAVLKTEFEWDIDIDDSLFSLEPPKGYTLEEKQFDVSQPGEKQLLEVLAFWAKMTKGYFPTAINDLGDQDKVKELLVAKYDRDGDPKEEFEDAYKKMNKILQALYFVQERKVDGSWGYAGDDVKLGESDVPICWWKNKDSDTYRVIYGDLSIADSNDIPQLEN